MHVQNNEQGAIMEIMAMIKILSGSLSIMLAVDGRYYPICDGLSLYSVYIYRIHGLYNCGACMEDKTLLYILVIPIIAVTR